MDIQMSFSEQAALCFVLFPEKITLEQLQRWGAAFQRELTSRGKVSLLLDTHTHDFESLACLRWLKEYLTENEVVLCNVERVAFVTPPGYRPTQIISHTEAYFSDRNEAHEWLAQSTT